MPVQVLSRPIELPVWSPDVWLGVSNDGRYLDDWRWGAGNRISLPICRLGGCGCEGSAMLKLHLSELPGKIGWVYWNIWWGKAASWCRIANWGEPAGIEGRPARAGAGAEVNGEEGRRIAGCCHTWGICCVIVAPGKRVQEVEFDRLSTSTFNYGQHVPNRTNYVRLSKTRKEYNQTDKQGIMLRCIPQDAAGVLPLLS